MVRIRPAIRLWLAPLFCLMLFSGVAHARSTKTTAKPQAAPAPIATASVLFEGKPVFAVAGFGSYTASARAAAISQRIAYVAKNARLHPDTIATATSKGVTTLTAGGLVLMTVTGQDAGALGKSQTAAAAFYAGKLREALTSLRHPFAIRVFLLATLYALLATVILFFLFKFLRLLYRTVENKLDTWRGTRIPSLRIQKYELLPADRIADFLILVLRVIALAVSVILLYTWVSLVLGFFPQTREYSRTLIHYISSTLGMIGKTTVHYLPNIFTIVILVVIARYLIRFTRVIFIEIRKGTITISGFHKEWAEPTYKIVRFLILVATAIIIFPYLPGSNSPAFKGISIFLGVLFSLGSSSAVANIVAGVILTYMRAFRLGDRVQIADTVGDVIEVSLLVTRIRTIKNVEITIANSMVLSSHIVNFSSQRHEDGVILHTTVTIGYDAPWRKIHELLISAAQATEGIVEQPTPFVLQTALDDFYVHYQINAYTRRPSEMAAIYSRLHQNIQDKFYEAGVEIMSPHVSNIRDGNRIAIPDDYLPPEYKSPSFRVKMEPTRAETEGSFQPKDGGN